METEEKQNVEIIQLSVELDRAGLVWYPSIGDEVADRKSLDRVSILVDPQGLTPRELREYFLWLPTVEQIVTQIEAREALIYHAGVNNSFHYETVVRTKAGVIEANALSLRLAFGLALKKLLANDTISAVH